MHERLELHPYISCNRLSDDMAGSLALPKEMLRSTHGLNKGSISK